MACLLASLLATGQCTVDYQGQHFYFMVLESLDQSEDISIYITNPNSFSTEVSISTPLLASVAHDIPAESSEVLYLSSSIAASGTSREDKGIRISSAGGDVSVMLLNQQGGACGGYQIIPQDALGDDYYVLSLWPMDPGNDKYGEIGVVAMQDDTTVTFEIMVGTGVKWIYDSVDYDSSNRILRVTLQEYETIQLQERRGNDISGTKVTANKNIAVFSGVKKINIGSGTQDHIVEQMIPTKAWGTTFALTKFPDQSSYAYKIIAKEADTSVNVLDNPLSDPGSFMAEEKIATDDIFISADKPILVAQYVRSQGTSADGAPSMVIVPPREQFLTSYSFTVPYDDSYTASLMLMADLGSEGGILLDRNNIGAWREIAGSSPAMVVTSVSVSPGYHEVEHDSLGFGAYVSGHLTQSICDFAFLPGQCLDDLHDVSVPLSSVVSFHLALSKI